MIDLNSALLCAQASQASYEEDSTVRRGLLRSARLSEIAYFQGKSDARGLFCQGLKQTILAFQGTQFTRGELASILENLDTSPSRYSTGLAMTGYLDQLLDLQELKLPAADLITGHSMGGAIAHLYSSASVTFGAPKCADQAFWGTHGSPTRFVHEADFAPDWPLAGYTQPGAMQWLHGGMITETASRGLWPWDLSLEDHSIENYIAALTALVGVPSS